MIDWLTPETLNLLAHGVAVTIVLTLILADSSSITLVPMTPLTSGAHSMPRLFRSFTPFRDRRESDRAAAALLRLGSGEADRAAAPRDRG